jgi:hypothetical protein
VFTGGTNYNDQSGDASIVINKINATCPINGFTGPMTQRRMEPQVRVLVSIQAVAAAAQLNLGASFHRRSRGTAHWTFTGGTNYNDQSGDAS